MEVQNFFLSCFDYFFNGRNNEMIFFSENFSQHLKQIIYLNLSYIKIWCILDSEFRYKHEYCFNGRNNEMIFSSKNFISTQNR